MKKIIIPLFCIVTILSSCKKKIDYSEEIQGKWLCQEINNFIQPTNEAFVINFHPGGSLTYAQGYLLSGNQGSLWMKNSDFSYSIADDEIKIQGTNPFGLAANISHTIKILAGSKLVYSENYQQIDNIDYAEDRTFILYRCNEDYQDQLIGNWEARKSFSSDSLTDYDVRFDFKSDMTFDYYIKDGTEWQLIHHATSYFVDGKLLSLNFSDGIQPFSDNNYNCLLIDNITSSKMTCWHYEKMPNSSNNLQGIKYEFQKIN